MLHLGPERTRVTAHPQTPPVVAATNGFAVSTASGLMHVRAAARVADAPLVTPQSGVRFRVTRERLDDPLHVAARRFTVPPTAPVRSLIAF
jgi:hypothetical protein